MKSFSSPQSHNFSAHFPRNKNTKRYNTSDLIKLSINLSVKKIIFVCAEVYFIRYLFNIRKGKKGCNIAIDVDSSINNTLFRMAM